MVVKRTAKRKLRWKPRLSSALLFERNLHGSSTARLSFVAQSNQRIYLDRATGRDVTT